MIVYDGINGRRSAARTRGGRRPGAGRPPTYSEPLVRKTVTLPVSYVEQLTTFGAGNLSDGIRLLIENAYTRNGKPWFSPPCTGSVPALPAISPQTALTPGGDMPPGSRQAWTTPRRPADPFG
jgi:hypothetical protein